MPVTAQDIRVIPGTLSFAGNQGTFTSSISAHGWYFNAISACGPDDFEFKN